MRIKPIWILIALLLVLGLVAGYRWSQGDFAAVVASAGVSGPYFKTQFQEESQFIVETIVSDVAEQMFYAKNHRLPDPKVFAVHAVEKAGSPQDQPVYAVSVVFASDHAPLQADLKIDGPIWSPEVYGGIVAQLAKEMGADPAAADGGAVGDSSLPGSLADASASTLENENKKVSEALEADFKNPLLHEEAALLLGAFALREHSGAFYDIRSPLCRITAHLSMARYLRGGKPPGIDGQIAGVMLLALMNDQVPALQELDKIGKSDPVVNEWARALQGFITGDYRALDKVESPSPIERVAWFSACAHSKDLNVAWENLSSSEKKLPDFARIANGLNYSVGTGHDLLNSSLRLELGELGSVYESSQGKKLGKDDVVDELNRMPERCFTPDEKGSPHVRVIGWGQWAMFFQRQLGHAMKSNFYYMQKLWGVPDQAAKFSAQNDKFFEGMRLYPFVRRLNCTDQAAYHSAVDDGFKVTVETPQLVPAECWNHLCYSGPNDEHYKPNPNPHVNEWHKHNPPPGTAYDAYSRLVHPSLTNRPDSGKVMMGLHELAPYDREIAWYIKNVDYKDKPTYEQAEALLRNTLPFNVRDMEAVAMTLRGQPARYEEFMAKIAGLDPANYFTMGDYFRARGEDDKAADYFERGSKEGPDVVQSSSYADWMVHYYLNKGQQEKARAVADAAGKVYSATGLLAKGEYFEVTGNYPEAFNWYSKILERYTDEPGALIGFCFRYKNKTGDGQYDAKLKL
ncbi:MAG: tetratricopeptide repeat protein, partial [Chthoniobacteraceae bacterium]